MNLSSDKRQAQPLCLSFFSTISQEIMINISGEIKKDDNLFQKGASATNILIASTF